MPVAAAARRPVSQSVSCFRPQSRRHRTRRDDAPRDGASPSEQRHPRVGGRPGPGHVARARGSRQNPASSSVAKLFECRAKRWQSPPVEPYTSANGLSRRHAACDRRRVTGAVRRRARSAAVRGRDFDLPRHSHYSGVIPMVFEHSAVAYTLHGVVRYPAIERVVERVPTDARRVASPFQKRVIAHENRICARVRSNRKMDSARSGKRTAEWQISRKPNAKPPYKGKRKRSTARNREPCREPTCDADERFLRPGKSLQHYPSGPGHDTRVQRPPRA